MTPEREALLDGLGFDWGKEKGQAIWDEKFVSRKQLVSRLNSSTAVKILTFMMMSHKEGIVCFQAAAWPLYS